MKALLLWLLLVIVCGLSAQLIVASRADGRIVMVKDKDILSNREAEERGLKLYPEYIYYEDLHIRKEYTRTGLFTYTVKEDTTYRNVDKKECNCTF